MKVFFSKHSMDGKYKWTCENFLKIVGYTKKEIVGVSSYEFFHPEDLMSIVKSHLNVGSLSQEVTYRLRTKEGKFIWARTFSHAIDDEIICLTIKLDILQLIMYKIFGY